MWEVCAHKAINKGARVQMNATVCGLHYDAGNNTWSVALSDGTTLEGFNHIISSAPIYDLIPGITPSVNAKTLQAAKGLGYRDFITVVLILKETTAFTENWIYIHEPSVKVGRIQNFKSWSREMVPDPDMNSYGLEYFCFEGDGMWTMSDDKLIELGTRELLQLGLAKKEAVVDGYVVRQPKATSGMPTKKWFRLLFSGKEWTSVIRAMKYLGKSRNIKKKRRSNSFYLDLQTLSVSP